MAQHLRPDGITNFYREGMLFKQIEAKPGKSLPLFKQAVSNWDNLDEDQKEVRHQERKNFIKSLYQLGSVLLDEGKPGDSLQTIKRCLAEDERSNYVSLLYKYFALGKIFFHLNCFAEARDALLFAMQCKTGQPPDFVCELLSRTYLGLGNTRRALEIINKISEKSRRPYVRWTEADVLCQLKDFGGAKRALMRSLERDNRSRHKALVRLAKIEYLLQDFRNSMKYAVEAAEFFSKKWGNFFDDGLFWQSISAYRLGDREKARQLALDLQTHNPRYPKLDLLLERLG
jgi:tetratricopeptide (TPR) repeat protein